MEHGNVRSEREKHETVDDYLPLSIVNLHRENMLRDGLSFGLVWTTGGQETDAVKIDVYKESLSLMTNPDTPYAFHQWVSIDRQACRYGGTRPYFVCRGDDGESCGLCVQKLYLTARRFVCRTCAKLVYQSQRENACLRAIRRANRVRVRLGGDPGMTNPFPPRPKGMHLMTYIGHFNRVQESEEAAASQFKIPKYLRAIRV